MVGDALRLTIRSLPSPPDIVLPVGLEPGLTVQGWQDERHAALVFTRDEADTAIGLFDQALTEVETASR